MRNKSEIKEMRQFLKDEMVRLETKGYKQANTYLKAEAKEYILDWVLESEM